MLDVIMGSREIISYRGWYAWRGGGSKSWVWLQPFVVLLGVCRLCIIVESYLLKTVVVLAVIVLKLEINVCIIGKYLSKNGHEKHKTTHLIFYGNN